MAKPVRRQRILVLVLIIGVVATRLTDGQAHASPVAASQGTAAIVNLNYEGDGPLHAPKIVNGINYQYDANGNLTNDGERIIEWNVENRVTSVKTVKPVTSVTEYVYDGDGRRIVKSVKNSKLVYVNNNLTIKQFNHETVPEYYYPLPPATAVKDENGLRYLHPDHLGSTRLITNSEGQTHAPGQTLSSINYFPYGEGVNESVSQRVNESRYLYTGQELDPETSLYNLNARLYNPTTGVFLSPDELSDPSSRGNRYQYAANNPTNFADTTGHCVGPLAIICVAVISNPAAATAVVMGGVGFLASLPNLSQAAYEWGRGLYEATHPGVEQTVNFPQAGLNLATAIGTTGTSALTAIAGLEYYEFGRQAVAPSSEIDQPDTGLPIKRVAGDEEAYRDLVALSKSFRLELKYDPVKVASRPGNPSAFYSPLEMTAYFGPESDVGALAHELGHHLRFLGDYQLDLELWDQTLSAQYWQEELLVTDWTITILETYGAPQEIIVGNAELRSLIQQLLDVGAPPGGF